MTVHDLHGIAWGAAGGYVIGAIEDAVGAIVKARRAARAARRLNR